MIVINRLVECDEVFASRNEKQLFFDKVMKINLFLKKPTAKLPYIKIWKTTSSNWEITDNFEMDAIIMLTDLGITRFFEIGQEALQSALNYLENLSSARIVEHRR